MTELFLLYFTWKAFVQREQPPPHRIEAVILLDGGARVLPQARGQRRILEQRADLFRQRLRILRRHEHARHAILPHFGNATHRRAARPRLS